MLNFWEMDVGRIRYCVDSNLHQKIGSFFINGWKKEFDLKWKQRKWSKHDRFFIRSWTINVHIFLFLSQQSFSNCSHTDWIILDHPNTLFPSICKASNGIDELSKSPFPIQLAWSNRDLLFVDWRLILFEEKRIDSIIWYFESQSSDSAYRKYIFVVLGDKDHRSVLADHHRDCSSRSAQV